MADDVERLMRQVVLNANEVGELLRVPTDTVKNLHRTKQLPGIMIGKHLRWRVQDVKQFVNELGNKK